jgi:hypothetical protein
LPDGFRYASDSNPQWMTSSQLQELVEASAPAKPRLIEPQKIGA